jgi:CRP-like cAMP-binding protein
MATTPFPSARPDNKLLARLPAPDYQRLLPYLRPVSFNFKQILYAAGARIGHVYFPSSGCLSALTIMGDGSAIEVATIGNEGMVGLMAFIGAETAPNEVIVQIAGAGLRMEVEAFKEQANRNEAFRRVLLLYHSAFQTQISYAVACNGLHMVEPRCCRWLLMTQDRLQSDVLPLTHEFLGIMLGVRRSTVTEVLHPLQEAGLIECGRGKIEILNRKGLEALSCECYEAVKKEFHRLLGRD